MARDRWGCFRVAPPYPERSPEPCFRIVSGVVALGGVYKVGCKAFRQLE
jgi:hypothetical protein